MKILGWDPGTTHLGYGVIELAANRSRCLAHGLLSGELDDLAWAIDGVFNTWLPDVTGYEDQAGVSFAKQCDGKTNFVARAVHEVVGMLRYAARCALDAPVPCYKAQPRSIKVALLGTGHGSADKKEITWGVERIFGVKANQHAADAIATAVAAARMHRVERARMQSLRRPRPGAVS